VYSGAMIQRFKIGNLAFKAVEVELSENGQRLWVTGNNIGDNHIF
jgi:hypothetical protein